VGNAKLWVLASALMNGSSPRAWGTRGGAIGGTDEARFIPTGVGNAGASFRLRINPSGSSPRAWGTLSLWPARPCQTRFIPTGVGNAASTASTARITTVHPHGRGERLTLATSRLKSAGSSPRAWGTRCWLSALRS